MQQKNSHSSRWVQTEAVKHTTPESIRRRIADEEKHIRALIDTGVTSGPVGQALEAHQALIRVLTKDRFSAKSEKRWNAQSLATS
jgi:hypothetical protein